MDFKYLYEKLKDEIKKEIPKFEIKYKNENKLQRFIGALLFFNKKYMTSYTTTMFSTVYYPSREFEEKSYKDRFMTLAHEFVHLYDMKKHWYFSLSYLFPQILSVFSVLGFLLFIHWSFSLFFIFLIFLSPFPSFFREKWEIRGYSMNMMLEKEFTGYILKESENRILEQFVSYNYYKMSYNREKVLRKLYMQLECNNSDSCEVPYQILKNIIKGN